MTPTEASNRTAAAMKRITEANPAALAFVLGIRFLAWSFRLIVYICIGFGTASVAHLSAWWGVPFALVSAQTLGRAYVWWRRDANVRAYEATADEAEKQAVK